MKMMMKIKYVIYALITLFGKIIVYAAAPILAMCVKYYPEDAYPVATKLGQDRPHLVPWLRWAQTFDDALDSYWYWESKSAWLRKWFSQDYYEKHFWLRWFTRVLWLWRNPAYGLALALGYDQTDVSIISDDDPDDEIWDQNIECSLMREFVNAKNQRGFLKRKRTKRFEFVLGYKVPWDDERKAMIAVRIKLRT